MKDLDRRLGRLEDDAQIDTPPVGSLLPVVMPDLWPADARDAFLAANERGDTAVMARTMVEQDGVTPAFGHPKFHLMIIRRRSDGPR